MSLHQRVIYSRPPPATSQQEVFFILLDIFNSLHFSLGRDQRVKFGILFWILPPIVKFINVSLSGFLVFEEPDDEIVYGIGRRGCWRRSCDDR